jgi:hypothetical protein
MRRAIIIGVLLLAGCGGGDDGGGGKAAPVPSGFKTLDGPDYTFAYPSGWKLLDDIEGAKGAQGPTGTAGLAPQAAVGRGKATASLPLSVDGLKTDNRVRRAGWTVVKDTDYKVDGAAGAHMLEATYKEVTGSTTTPVRTIDVLVQTKKGVALDLFLRAPDADFDKVGLRKVLDTFRLK